MVRRTVAMTDQQFHLGVAGGGIALVIALTAVRFCGSTPALPAKPPPPEVASGTQAQLMEKSAASPQVYLDYLAKDATQAGVPSPTREEMSRKFPYRVDEARHLLEVGQPAIELAGLKLRVVKGIDSFNLEITNTTGSNAAYEIVTEPIPNASTCAKAPPLQLNVLVIAKNATETRVECTWHDGMALAVKKVETLELGPLQSYYLSEVPPEFVGIDPRIARSHHGVENKQGCGNRAGSVVTGIDRGEITWRDLVDFYARHRCQTYHFPAAYRALTSDGQRPIPATGAGM
jgi:hypothetical protein